MLRGPLPLALTEAPFCSTSSPMEHSKKDMTLEPSMLRVPIAEAGACSVPDAAGTSSRTTESLTDSVSCGERTKTSASEIVPVPLSVPLRSTMALYAQLLPAAEPPSSSSPWTLSVGTTAPA